MHRTSGKSRRRRWLAVRLRGVIILVSVLGVGAGGCHSAANPFHDELVSAGEITTASAEGARAAHAERRIQRRSLGPVEVRPADGAVIHGPLFFEDPFEDKGSEDGQFAWTGEDYWDLAYGPARFLLNAVLAPVSALVTSPRVAMTSDGRLSRQLLGMDHDAARAATSGSPGPASN